MQPFKPPFRTNLWLQYVPVRGFYHTPLLRAHRAGGSLSPQAAQAVAPLPWGKAKPHQLRSRPAAAHLPAGGTRGCVCAGRGTPRRPSPQAAALLLRPPPASRQAARARPARPIRFRGRLAQRIQTAARPLGCAGRGVVGARPGGRRPQPQRHGGSAGRPGALPRHQAGEDDVLGVRGRPGQPGGGLCLSGWLGAGLWGGRRGLGCRRGARGLSSARASARG